MSTSYSWGQLRERAWPRDVTHLAVRLDLCIEVDG